jgi:hypothetical protein
MHAALYASPSLIQFSERIHEIHQKIKFIVFFENYEIIFSKNSGGASKGHYVSGLAGRCQSERAAGNGVQRHQTMAALPEQ